MISYFKDLKRRIKYSIEYRLYEKSNPGNYHSIKAFDYYHCICIHIPKAAGMSINKSLFGNYGGAHKTIRFYEDFYAKHTFEKYYKFTFVRNPWTRLYSAFNYLKYGGINANERDLAFGKKHFENMDFQTFVMDWLNADSIFYYEHFYPQNYFLKNNKGEICCDFIGKVESINDDYEIIRQKLKIKTTLQMTNTSKKSSLDVREIYTTEMKEKVNDLYREDIELFKYIF